MVYMNQDDIREGNSKPSLFEKFKGLFVFDNNQTQATQEPTLQEETPATAGAAQQTPPTQSVQSAPETPVDPVDPSLPTSDPAPTPTAEEPAYFGAKLDPADPFEHITPEPTAQSAQAPAVEPTPTTNVPLMSTEQSPTTDAGGALGPMPTFEIDSTPAAQVAPAGTSEVQSPVGINATPNVEVQPTPTAADTNTTQAAQAPVDTTDTVIKYN
jgi:hypothetical protein